MNKNNLPESVECPWCSFKINGYLMGAGVAGHPDILMPPNEATSLYFIAHVLAHNLEVKKK